MKIRYAILVGCAVLLMQQASAETITETYDDPHLGKVERTISTIDEPNYKSYSVSERSSNVKDLSPEQQARLLSAMTQWRSDLIQNSMQSSRLLQEFVKTSGLPLDDKAFQEGTRQATELLSSDEMGQMMQKNMGAMLKILPQMERRSAQLIQQMQEQNQLLQQQMNDIFQ